MKHIDDFESQYFTSTFSEIYCLDFINIKAAIFMNSYYDFPIVTSHQGEVQFVQFYHKVYEGMKRTSFML